MSCLTRLIKFYICAVLVHLHFLRMTVTIFISFFFKSMCFRVSLLFSLKNIGGRAPMVYLFYFDISQAFLDLLVRFKILRGAV